ncbi:MAG: hypothetical protein H6Q75_106 [Firmicutes bacterium]|nr:hypothetical protein [Bacillota bacterium]
MIKVKIYRNSSGTITGFSVNGHANTAPHGQDIVCAGVAALTQTAVLGLERHLNRQFRLDFAEGKLVIELTDAPDALTDAVLETMLLGLMEIAQISPNGVRISEHRR